jgi:hypothetical protein
MSEPISTSRLRTAKTVLRLIGLVSLIPLLYIAYQSVVTGGAFDLYTTLSLDDWGIAVFAILLLIGVGLVVFVGKTVEVIFILPTLFLALLPIYQHLVPKRTVYASVTNPWQRFDGNMRALMDMAEAERTGSVPFVERQVVRNEYAMIRNGGLRMLTFSEWNGGIRAMTDAYWRGDDPAEFRLGGSYWTINTGVGAAEDCDAGEIYHTYYSYNGTGVNRDLGNRCRAEIADIFVRPRMLPDLVQTDE